MKKGWKKRKSKKKSLFSVEARKSKTNCKNYINTRPFLIKHINVSHHTTFLGNLTHGET